MVIETCVFSMQCSVFGNKIDHYKLKFTGKIYENLFFLHIKYILIDYPFIKITGVCSYVSEYLDEIIKSRYT